jgi:hypothetical protein
VQRLGLKTRPQDSAASTGVDHPAGDWGLEAKQTVGIELCHESVGYIYLQKSVPLLFNSPSRMPRKGLNKVTRKTVQHVDASVDFPQEPALGARIKLRRTMTQAGTSQRVEVGQHVLGIPPALSPQKSPLRTVSESGMINDSAIPMPDFDPAGAENDLHEALRTEADGDFGTELVDSLNTHSDGPLASLLQDPSVQVVGDYVQIQTTQSTHNLMRDFVTHHKGDFIQLLLEREGCRNVSQCNICREELPANKRFCCEDCLGLPHLCEQCVRRSHRLDPLHRVTKWTGDCFQPCSTEEITLLCPLYLGHEGHCCPRFDDSVPNPHPRDFDSNPNRPLDDNGRSRVLKRMTIGHTNGFHVRAIVPCTCPGSGAVWQQLLRRGLWPATFKYPETAFTLDCLSLCRNVHLECKGSLSSYHTLLQVMTSMPLGTAPPVSLV